MARKPPIPEIPPIPSGRSGRSAVGSRQMPARTAPPQRSEEPELPDLLEAFWGDGANARDVLPRTRGRDCASRDLE